MELPAESERSWYPCSTTTEQTGDTERPVSRISNRSVFSSPNSTLSSLDISVYNYYAERYKSPSPTKRRKPPSGMMKMNGGAMTTSWPGAMVNGPIPPSGGPSRKASSEQDTDDEGRGHSFILSAPYSRPLSRTSSRMSTMSQTSPLMSKSTQTNITKLSGEIELTTASEPKAIENKRSRKSRISKDDVEEAELQIMVDGEPINFSELDIPQPDCLNSANLMTCISKQTKVLEAAVRELRGELSTSKHLSSSSSSSKGQPGGSNDFLSASKEAAVLSDVSKQCAVTLKHIKGFYDQTRYLKGLINRMEADLAWRCRKNGESDRLRNISLAAVAAMGLACCLAYYLNQTYPDEVKTWACFTGLWMKTFLVGKFDAMSKFLKRSPIPQHVKPTLTTATP